MIRVLLADDEKASRTSLKKLLTPYPQIEILGEAKDGLEAVEKIEEEKPDLIFLDIQMPGLNGFEVLRALRPEVRPRVIFVTAYDQYAVKAFEVNAVDYLLKPIEENRLNQALEKILQGENKPTPDLDKINQILLSLQKPQASPLHLPLRRGKKIVLMSPDNILFLRSEQGVTIVMTPTGEYWSSYTLVELEAMLDGQIFFRSHRSTIINLNKVKEIVPLEGGACDIYLMGFEKDCLPLSRDRARVLRERYKF
jgi:two-component system LytT family response regulator/two-component system response regulator LytT